MFDATHVEVERWFAEGLVDGVRIDHPDGLSDPGRLSGVAARADRPRRLDRDREDPGRRRSAGTHAAGGRHHRLRRAARDRRPVHRSRPAAPALTDLVDSAGVDYHAMPELRANSSPTRPPTRLASELGRLRRAIVAAAGADHPQLPEAVAALLSHIDVYRSRLPAGWRRCCRPRWPKPPAARPELADRCS